MKTDPRVDNFILQKKYLSFSVGVNNNIWLHDMLTNSF